MVIGLLIIFVLFFGTNLYISWRACGVLKPLFPQLNSIVFYILYFVIASSVIVYFVFNSAQKSNSLNIPIFLKTVVSWCGCVFMGLFVYLLLFFLIRDIIWGLGLLTKLIKPSVSPSYKVVSGIIVLVLSVGVSIYGIFNAMNIKTQTYDVKIDNKHIDEPIKIGLITDIHLGAVNSENNLAKEIDALNKENPHIICIGGDIFNDNLNTLQDKDRIISEFKKLNPKYGVYACLGNHDGGSPLSETTELLNNCGIILLNEEYRVIDNKFVLTGRVDARPIGRFEGKRRVKIGDVLQGLDGKLPVIVMDHNPQNVNEYGNETDLLLCGHTHNGQIFPANIITDFIYESDYGMYKRDNNSPTVVISSGAGYWGMPMRVGTQSEIVTINIK